MYGSCFDCDSGVAVDLRRMLLIQWDDSVCQVVYKTNDDHVTVIGAGVTLHEALAAAEQLKKGTRLTHTHSLMTHRLAQYTHV